MIESNNVITDYADTAGKVRAFAKSVSLQQPGDPVRLARAVIELTRADRPPLRLPLGSDTVAAIGEKHAFVSKELAAWRALATSTDFPR